MESGKVARPRNPLPVRILAFTALALATGCIADAPERPTTAPPVDDAPPAASPATSPPGQPVLAWLDAPTFRPVVFADTGALWGIARGRLARLRPADGRLEAQPYAAWSVAGGPGVVSWRNETGTWGMRAGDFPRRLAPTELMPGYDGPPDALWSPDGTRAMLSWQAEWDAHHELLEADGSRRAVANTVEGYMLDHAALWLDERRVLFEIVASGPKGGEPEYRESGWRGDFAVLDLESGEYRRVTDVADGTFLRAAGRLDRKVLARAHGSGGAIEHWLYDPVDWSRTPRLLPAGRTFAAADVVVGLSPAAGAAAAEDRWNAWLAIGADTTALGAAADPDLAPALSADGRRIALRILRDGRPTLLLIRR